VSDLPRIGFVGAFVWKAPCFEITFFSALVGAERLLFDAFHFSGVFCTVIPFFVFPKGCTGLSLGLGRFAFCALFYFFFFLPACVNAEFLPWTEIFRAVV